MKSTKKPTYADIRLPYYKQGDDLHDCISTNADGKVDAKKTLENHINLLECTIKQLKDINDLIPLENDVVLEGNTHWITITGNEQLIGTLIEHELAYKCFEFSEDVSDGDENDDSVDEDDLSKDDSIEENQL